VKTFFSFPATCKLSQESEHGESKPVNRFKTAGLLLLFKRFKAATRGETTKQEPLKDELKKLLPRIRLKAII
jgi:hypothetical protein